MSWLVRIDGGSEMRVHDRNEIRLVIAGIALGAGISSSTGEVLAKGMIKDFDSAESARMFDRSKTVEVIRAVGTCNVRLLPGDPPEDPTRQCDGYDSWGDRCGRYMNHRGDCDSGRH